MVSSGEGRPFHVKSSRIPSRFHLRLYVSAKLTFGRVKRSSLTARRGLVPRHKLSWSCPHAYGDSEPDLFLYVFPSYTLWFLTRFSAHGRGGRQARRQGRKGKSKRSKGGELDADFTSFNLPRHRPRTRGHPKSLARDSLMSTVTHHVTHGPI
jgi:hypothetical protein